MRDDEEALVVCNPIDGKYLLAKGFPEEVLVIVSTSILPNGELIMKPKKEFINYLNEGFN